MTKHIPSLSPMWRHAVIMVLILEFSVLIGLAVKTYSDAPPIPERVVSPSGELLFTRDDILQGQQIFLKYGLMDNGTIWGHGAYLGPDFSAAYLHEMVVITQAWLSEQRFGLSVEEISPEQRWAVKEETRRLLKQNRYDTSTKTLTFIEPQVLTYTRQIKVWTDYFARPEKSAGLPPKYIHDREEIRQLTAFFAWTAWASIANRPGKTYSYTNNFPYDPDAGNTPTTAAILWSALSLIGLLAGTGLILFIFGKFDFLGWKGEAKHVHPKMLPGTATPFQRAAMKYFVFAVLLFLIQVLVGGATAHYRAEPGDFYGIDLSNLFPSNILRTWHLQLAIFWIATAYIAGGLFLASTFRKRDDRGWALGVHVLFWSLLVVVAGSLIGEYLGINHILDKQWFWWGHQGWEYLELGRVWQILLAIGLGLWVILLVRQVRTSMMSKEDNEIASLFLYAAFAIPLFYLPAMFFNSTTHFSVVDTWRFWIIHLWVEGFFELFVTVMVAIIFYKLGLVSTQTAARVVYLDAILYLGSGIIGTGHHWYWTGQSTITMALGATFSALEVVPLTLLTLDAWDFIKLTRGRCDICGKSISIPHRWTFYFLMAVGFWNFVGAGIFGFLINLPIVSYFEVGTLLTSNHGHTAMMGVFGMLAVALIVFAIRQMSTDEQWERNERFVSISFWGLNIGLALMAAINLFPGGVLQLVDVLENGYWHARSPAFLNKQLIKLVEWLRLPADAVFIAFGVVPLFIAAIRTYLSMPKMQLLSPETKQKTV